MTEKKDKGWLREDRGAQAAIAQAAELELASCLSQGSAETAPEAFGYCEAQVVRRVEALTTTLPTISKMQGPKFVCTTT